MSPLRLSADEAAVLRAVNLVHRYSLGLDRLADQALGDQGTDNIDLQILLAIRAGHGVSPSEVVATLGRPRSTVSRGLARLLDADLVERRTHQGDRRRAELQLTARGWQGVERFEEALAGFFEEEEPIIKELMLLFGRDPERARAAAGTPSVLEVADRMALAGSGFVHDVRQRMRPFGAVESVERNAVMVLAQHWARPTQLADELWLSPAGVTSLLERLEGVGLVVREAGVLHGDRRAVVVHLTPRGRRAARVVLSVFAAHREALLDALEPTLGFGGRLAAVG